MAEGPTPSWTGFTVHMAGSLGVLFLLGGLGLGTLTLVVRMVRNDRDIRLASMFFWALAVIALALYYICSWVQFSP